MEVIIHDRESVASKQLSTWYRQILIMSVILCIVMLSLFGSFMYWVMNHPTHDHHRCPVAGCGYNQKAGN